ncbi:MAG: hypothetical protein KDD82_00435 [Planctomycetes bacterium]|nr:hypothetical protein [Planctomycetota bacterium]
MIFPHERFQKLFTESAQRCEQWAADWWSEHLRKPETLSGMGDMLGAMCTLKERWNKGLEQTWAHWRLPSALDMERLYERLGELEEHIARLEDQLEDAPQRPQTPAQPVEA